MSSGISFRGKKKEEERKTVRRAGVSVSTYLAAELVASRL